VPYLSILKYALPFAAGVALTLLWHGYVTRGVQIEQQAVAIEQAHAVEEVRKVDTVANNENTRDYLGELENARKEANVLRDGLNSGRIAIRLCRADAVAAGVSEGNSRAIADQARSDRAKLENDVIALLDHARRNDAWIESAFEFINRARQ
jgi:hypothetical protein